MCWSFSVWQLLCPNTFPTFFFTYQNEIRRGDAHFCVRLAVNCKTLHKSAASISLASPHCKALSSFKRVSLCALLLQSAQCGYHEENQTRDLSSCTCVNICSTDCVAVLVAATQEFICNFCLETELFFYRLLYIDRVFPFLGMYCISHRF